MWRSIMTDLIEKRISRAEKARSRCLDKDMINFWNRVIAYFENKLERTIH